MREGERVGKRERQGDRRKETEERRQRKGDRWKEIERKERRQREIKIGRGKVKQRER